MKHGISTWLRQAFVATWGLLFLLALSLLFAASQHNRVLTVESNSMVPTFHKGDALLLHSASASNVAVGDVIAYRSLEDPDVIISHRLVLKHPSNRLITKGDASSQTDKAIGSERIVGRAVAYAPGLGYVLTVLQLPVIRLVLVYIPACLVVAYELYAIANTRRTASYHLARQQ